MGTLTIDLPAQEDQTAFNVRRWSELLADTAMGRELARIEGRIETDRHGHIIMSPPPGFRHGSYQFALAKLLNELAPSGRTVTECPISTADGVRATDVAWISHAKLAQIGENVCLTQAPEICVEVLSPDNTRKEMAEKKALYFAAGAAEVWFCDENGSMTFFSGEGSMGEKESRAYPHFPAQIQL
jgi:Uma2 family endonuclease